MFKEMNESQLLQVNGGGVPTIVKKVGGFLLGKIATVVVKEAAEAVSNYVATLPRPSEPTPSRPENWDR